MGSCLSSSEGAGAADIGKPGAYTIKVKLTEGREFDCAVLPSDTMSAIDAKVQAVYGKQPPVAVKGRMVDPVFNAKYEGKWVPVRWDATVGQVLPPSAGKGMLKYSDVTDILRKVRLARHAHWVGSHIIQ